MYLKHQNKKLMRSALALTVVFILFAVNVVMNQTNHVQKHKMVGVYPSGKTVILKHA